MQWPKAAWCGVAVSGCLILAGCAPTERTPDPTTDPTPSSVEQAPRKPTPQLSLELVLDKSAYTRTDTVRALVGVSNDGAADAEHVVLDCSGTSAEATTALVDDHKDVVPLNTTELGGLGSPDGLTLPTGDIQTGQVSGPVTQNAYDIGVLVVTCELRAEGGTSVVEQVTAQVTGASNTVNGRFAVCENNKAVRGAAGVQIELHPALLDESTATPPEPVSTITDADGRFSFPAVPAGPWEINYSPPAGYAENTNGPWVSLLVTTSEIRWSIDELSVTPKDPATACTNS